MQHNLRRWALPALLTLAAACAFVGPAFSAWRVDDSVRWRHAGGNALGFSLPQPAAFSDTLLIAAAPARADTTTAWTMLDCDDIMAGDAGITATTADSLASAFLAIVADSSVASSVNFKSTTVTLQVNWGLNSSGWQTFDAIYTPNPTDGQKTLLVPIFSRFLTITADAGPNYTGIGPGFCFAPQMRAIVTWGASAAAPSCRIRVRKFIRSQMIVLQGKDL